MEERGKYSQLSGMELVAIVRKPMSRATALKILGLEGLPAPKDYEEKVKKLLVDSADELGKRAEILAAHNRLLTDHEFVVKELRSSAKRVYAEYQKNLPNLISKVAGHSGDEQLIATLGKQLDKVNRDYITALETPGADSELLTKVYHSTISHTKHLAKCLIHKEVELELGVSLETFRADMSLAYEQVESRDADTNDYLTIFKQEFDHYLSDILKIRGMESDLSWQVAIGDEADESLLSYTRHQDNLQHLFTELQQFGDHYFTEIAKDGADILQLQKEFNKGFKNIVADAKKSFAKEPGIWANLNIYLQILFVCTVIPALIILACEKKEDRNRLFNGPPKGEVNIQQIWHEWEMDVLPNPSDNTVKRGIHGG